MPKIKGARRQDHSQDLGARRQDHGQDLGERRQDHGQDLGERRQDHGQDEARLWLRSLVKILGQAAITLAI